MQNHHSVVTVVVPNYIVALPKDFFVAKRNQRLIELRGIMVQLFFPFSYDQTRQKEGVDTQPNRGEVIEIKTGHKKELNQLTKVVIKKIQVLSIRLFYCN